MSTIVVKSYQTDVRSKTVTGKSYIRATLLAWILFVGIDFLFHASLLASLWKEKVAGFKPLDELALLIPAGYGSFLLLTVFIAYLYFRIFKQRPGKKEVIEFAAVAGALFSISNLLALYSFVAIPFLYLLLFNAVYFIEFIFVTWAFHSALHTPTPKKTGWMIVIFFLILLVTGVIIQNVIK